ncbi:hypothetical protein EDB83DRAFT_2527206 [Lactarius deliciosus]|nr:hypothetical protein EDB83DRAFT_2527206 [Lactarius deliciosus]
MASPGGTGAPSNPPAGGSGTAGATPASASGTGASSAASGTGATPAGSGGTDVVINEKPFSSDPAWPADLLLNRLKSNWERWDLLISDPRALSGSYGHADNGLL